MGFSWNSWPSFKPRFQFRGNAEDQGQIKEHPKETIREIGHNIQEQHSGLFQKFNVMRHDKMRSFIISWFEKKNAKHGGVWRNVNVDYIIHIRRTLICLGMVMVLWLILRTCMLKLSRDEVSWCLKLTCKCFSQHTHARARAHAHTCKYDKMLTVDYKRW